jgi:hypothetical protein
MTVFSCSAFDVNDRDPIKSKAVNEIRNMIRHHLLEKHLKVFAALLASVVRLGSEPLEEDARVVCEWL